MYIKPGIEVVINDKNTVASFNKLLEKPVTKPIGEKMIRNYHQAKKVFVKNLTDDYKSNMRKNLIRNHSFVTGKLYKSIRSRIVDENKGEISVDAENNGFLYGLSVERGYSRFINDSIIRFDDGEYRHLKNDNIHSVAHPFIKPSLENRQIKKHLAEFMKVLRS